MASYLLYPSPPFSIWLRHGSSFRRPLFLRVCENANGCIIEHGKCILLEAAHLMSGFTLFFTISREPNSLKSKWGTASQLLYPSPPLSNWLRRGSSFRRSLFLRVYENANGCLIEHGKCILLEVAHLMSGFTLVTPAVWHLTQFISESYARPNLVSLSIV